MQLSCREKEMAELVPAAGCAAGSERRERPRSTTGTGLHSQAAHPAPAASRLDDPSPSQLSAAAMALLTQNGALHPHLLPFVQEQHVPVCTDTPPL